MSSATVVVIATSAATVIIKLFVILLLLWLLLLWLLLLRLLLLRLLLVVRILRLSRSRDRGSWDCRSKRDRSRLCWSFNFNNRLIFNDGLDLGFFYFCNFLNWFHFCFDCWRGFGHGFISRTVVLRLILACCLSWIVQLRLGRFSG